MLDKFTKHDEDKTRFDLLHGPFIEGIADVLTYGAKKYDDNNWHKCDKMSRYFGALMRHLWAWWFTREDFDKESGKHHAFHAGCCLMFLYGLQQMHGEKADDRPKIVFKETK